MFRDGLLDGKRILITGGSAGLGKSVGKRYVQLGADLIICGRQQQTLDQAAEEFKNELGVHIETYCCDVSNAGAVEDMIQSIWAKQPLDVLINNASSHAWTQSNRLAIKDFDSTVDTILKGSAYCTLAVGRRWIDEKKQGVILSMLTQSSFTGLSFSVSSAMAKAGVQSMTQSLAVEWGPYGIRVVGVIPGPFPTKSAWSRLVSEEKAKQGHHSTNSVALRRLGKHEELADLCVYLITDSAGFITGESVVIDGGRWLQGAAGQGVFEMQSWSNDTWDNLKLKK